MYEHILVALDGSKLAEHVLPHVEALAEKFGSSITLLRATLSAEEVVAAAPMGVPFGDLAVAGRVPGIDTTDAYETILDAERTETESYLNAVVERLRGKGLNVTGEHAEGKAADVILERAGALGADLIAMTTHGRSGLARVFLGSVADDVVRRSNCPVLLVRVHDADHSGETAERRAAAEESGTGRQEGTT
jgi:nucleotide-binding universal stress UspA family protein